MVVILLEKDSILGSEIGESGVPVSSALEEPKPNLETIEHKCVDLNKETRCEEPSKTSLQISRSSNCKGSIPPSVIEEDGRKNKDPEIEAFHYEYRSPLYAKEVKEENAFSSGDVRIQVSKKDSSHESVESSNSGRLFSTAKRAWKFEQELFIGNKKMKKFDNETHVSASFLKQDSSFLSWIFNMTNRNSKSNPDNLPLLASSAKSFHDRPGNHNFLFGTCDAKHSDGGNKSMGFQTLFRAMSCPKLEVQCKQVRDSEPRNGAESSKELEVVNDGLDDCDKNSRASKICLGDRNNSSNSERNRPIESLWIAGFSPKVSAPILKALPCNQDTGAAQEPFIEDLMGDRGRKLISCSIIPTSSSGSKKSIKDKNQKLEDKLNHMLHYETSTGHHDSDIPRKKDLELLEKPKAMASVYAHKVAGSSRKGKGLMTNAHSSNDPTEVLNVSKSLLGSRPIKNDVLDLGDNCFKGLFGKRWGFSSFSKVDSKENQIASCNLINRQVPVVPEAIFESVRRLRVSRSNILRWIETPYPGFHFEGYFLRLRLGKWEEELGGTGYHVACIIGKCQESSCGRCRFPLFVKLGGVKCLVHCRYVSNHDFVEEELMAWWSATMRGGDKLPSLEELNLKLQEKQKWSI